MGLEDYLLTAVLRGVLAQRLVRRLCTACRRPAAAPPELVERFGLERRAPMARRSRCGTRSAARNAATPAIAAARPSPNSCSPTRRSSG